MRRNDHLCLTAAAPAPIIIARAKSQQRTLAAGDNSESLFAGDGCRGGGCGTTTGGVCGRIGRSRT